MRVIFFIAILLLSSISFGQVNLGDVVKNDLRAKEIHTALQLANSLDNRREYKAAAQQYEFAADGGIAEAQYKLANYYLSGKGVDKNTEKYVEWIKKAAEQNYIDAVYSMGHIYKSKFYGAPNYKKAIEYFEKAVQQGYADAMLEIAIAYDTGNGYGQNKNKALEWMIKAANAGSERAYMPLATLYYNGNSTYNVERDYKNAFKWFKKAAGNSSVEAHYYAGMMLLEGKGTERDIKLGINTLEYAANNNNLDACYYLGMRYKYGGSLGIKNEEKAIKYFKKAKELGSAMAAAHLEELISPDEEKN